MHTYVEAPFATPGGHVVRFRIREGTSDWNTCNAITAAGNEYNLPSALSGWAVDIGSHIGACAVSLLVDNPYAQGIAVEALPENVDLIRQNARINGVQDRLTVLHAGAAKAGRKFVKVGYGEVADPTGIHEFIGNAWAPEGSRFAKVPAVSLADVLEITGNATIEWMKIDCEGCELGFLDSPLVGRIRHIEGEVHPQCGGERLRALLQDTHRVHFPKWDENPNFGPFQATLR